MSAIADRPSVLIVDDDGMVRELLGAIFTASGYQCRLATNGMEAIEAFRAERPDLSVTDIRMPVLDGLQFLKQALTLEPDAAVLVLTGVGDVQTAVEVLNGGAYDFIQKPVNPEELLIKAGRALRASPDTSLRGGARWRRARSSLPSPAAPTAPGAGGAR